MGRKSNHKAIGYPRNSHAIIIPMVTYSLGVSHAAQLATVAGPLLHPSPPVTSITLSCAVNASQQGGSFQSSSVLISSDPIRMCTAFSATGSYHLVLVGNQ